MPELHVARSESILGGEPGGKNGRAQSLASAWLARSAEHRAVFVAAALGWDEALPRGRDARAFIDSLGGLNREAAAACERVTQVSGGIASVLKGAA